MDKDKIYCYKCEKELNLCSCVGNFNSVLVYSKKYKRWLTTRDKKNLLTCLSSAESSFKIRLEKIEETKRKRREHLHNLKEKGFIKDYKYIESEDSSYGSVITLCDNCQNNFETRYDHFLERVEKAIKDNNINENKTEDIKILCSDCLRLESNKILAKKRSGPGKCTCCNEYSEKRDSVGLCLKCRSERSKKDRENNTKAGICKSCGSFNNQRNNVGLGIECGCSQKMYSQRGMRNKWCEKCNAETLHNEETCTICNPKAKAGDQKFNFIVKDNVRFYKGIEINEFIGKIKSGELNIEDYPGMNWRGNRLCYYTEDILTGDIYNLCGSFYEINDVKYYRGIEINEFTSKILSGELNIEDYPGINIRCGRVCYYTEDILTSEKILMNNNFTELDGIKFYKNIEIHELIRQLDSGEIKIPPGFNKRFGEWFYHTENILTGEILKLNNNLFEERNNVLYYYDKSEDVRDYITWEEYKVKFPTFNIGFKLPEGFKMYPTFLTQDSEHENVGGAFEQSLVDENISWFVYIKFDELNRPLVCGKSGSKLVNSKTDVLFSMKIEHGPSRRFLQDNSLNWCKTQIAICPCETEQEAYDLEERILKDYNLFGS